MGFGDFSQMLQSLRTISLCEDSEELEVRGHADRDAFYGLVFDRSASRTVFAVPMSNDQSKLRWTYLREHHSCYDVAGLLESKIRFFCCIADLGTETCVLCQLGGRT